MSWNNHHKSEHGHGHSHDHGDSQEHKLEHQAEIAHQDEQSHERMEANLHSMASEALAEGNVEEYYNLEAKAHNEHKQAEHAHEREQLTHAGDDAKAPGASPPKTGHCQPPAHGHNRHDHHHQH